MPDYASMKQPELRKLIPNDIEKDLPNLKKQTLVDWLTDEWNKQNG